MCETKGWCVLALSTVLTAGCAARTGGIRGPVTDETGRPVTAARVTVTRVESGEEWRAAVNGRGWYFVDALQPGRYEVRAEAPQYIAATPEPVRLSRGECFTLGLRLGIPVVAPLPPPPAPPMEASIDLGIEGGVAGGVEGGTAGGVVGGVIGGLPPPVAPVRVGGAVQAPRTLNFAAPAYPALARQARVTGPLELSARYVGPMNTEGYARIDEEGFLDPRQHPLSTFSVDVDTASYANSRRILNEGRLPPKDAVRIEEFINYFDYDYPQPPPGEPFSVHTEVGTCPWAPSHRLALVGLQGRDIPEADLPPRNLVFLLDVSGSMRPAHKLPLLKSALRLLASRLTARDHVAIVVYAGSSGLVLPRTRGDHRDEILGALDRLEAGGSTNGGAGIDLAYRIAQEGLREGAVNRVVLATDGDFNVGVTDLGALTRLIEEKRESGVFLSVLGFGEGNLQDATMEALADRGNGNYSYVDTVQEARKVLVREAGGTLVTIAKDVKIQVELNPMRVGAYRLVGYENRRLRDEDFNDDRKDAGEIGAGHRVTALYEIVPPEQEVDEGDVDPLKYQQALETPPARASDELMTVKLRFKEPDGDESRLLTRVVRETTEIAHEVSSDFAFATAVAEFAIILRDSEYKDRASLESVMERAQRDRGRDPDGDRAEFARLVALTETLQLAGDGRTSSRP